jgi:two-component system LytT family response regulator
MITAFIADDEPLARRKLRDLLAGIDWIECVGEAADGEATLRALEELTPDLAFLDIRMPRLSALEVLERVRHKPAVIFTTAYDKYAVTAFELQALDYLVKPFGAKRFRAALERARRALGEDACSPTEERAQLAMSSGGHLVRIFVRERGRIVPLAVEDISRLEARDDYVSLHVQGRAHLVHVTLGALEARLDSQRFIRVHRSHVVNVDHVAALVPYDGTRLEVQLKDGTRLVASRARSRDIRHLVM